MLEKLCLPIKTELEGVERVIQQEIASQVPFVTNVAQYIVGNGGKRLRPALCLLAARMAGYSGEHAARCAAALEFVHTASLLHDDVLDNAELRRGKPSANQRWGNQISVLVGDFFYCRASALFTRTGNFRIMALTAEMIAKTTEGEILEITTSNNIDLTEEDYLRIIRHKTAVLMGASTEVGALLANLGEELTVALRDYGTHLGLAFQLVDDVLDYTSNDAQLGKAAGTDLKEGKLTLPLIVALRKANAQEGRLIRDTLLTEKLSGGRLHEVFSLLEKYGGISYTLDLARTYATKAKESLAPFKPSIEKETLLQLATYVTERHQ